MFLNFQPVLINHLKTVAMHDIKIINQHYVINLNVKTYLKFMVLINSRRSLLMKFNNFREIKEVCYFDETAIR